jgi:hypothetical protein
MGDKIEPAALFLAGIGISVVGLNPLYSKGTKRAVEDASPAIAYTNEFIGGGVDFDRNGIKDIVISSNDGALTPLFGVSSEGGMRYPGADQIEFHRSNTGFNYADVSSKLNTINSDRYLKFH